MPKMKPKAAAKQRFKITATGKLEPEMVDAILNAWKAYAGGDSHAVQ